MLKKRAAGEGDPEEMDATAAAKLFEEVKVMFRDLPSRVEGHLREHGMTKRRRRFHPMMFEEIFHTARTEGEKDPAAAWLFISSFFRDDVPWFSEIALQLYRAYNDGDVKQIEKAQNTLSAVTRMARHSRLMMRGPEDEEAYVFLRHLPEMLEHFALIPPPKERRPRRAKDELPPDEQPEVQG